MLPNECLRNSMNFRNQNVNLAKRAKFVNKKGPFNL